MVIGGTTLALLLLIYYFVKATASEQYINLDYSSEVLPRKARVETTMDIEAPPDIIWKTLTDLSRYRLWYPWVHRLRVTNVNADRWVHKHSLLKYQLEVGSFFSVQPFFGAPYNPCRFITIDPGKKLVMEMCFFPFNKEIVTFSLSPYKNCVELSYSSTSNSLINFITAFMFSWQGKLVLRNFNDMLPDLDYNLDTSEAGVSTPQYTIDNNFINALISKAFDDGVDILNGIAEKVVRAKAKSGLVKAKRAGAPPHASPEALSLVTQFLSGEPAPPSNAISDSTAIHVPEDIRIKQYILKGLDGDLDIINAIDDRVLRAKVKSGLTKAKRTGERPEIPADTPPLGTEATPTPTAPLEEGDEQVLINTYVVKAMNGDEELISTIENRILRAKVKSALVKAKRSGVVPEISEINERPASRSPSDEEPVETDLSIGSPDIIIDQAVQAALDGNMDLINGIDDRVQRAKAKSALAKAKRNR